MPEATIGADVMVGFPGETDALFEESYRFIAEQPFTYLHLFPFSARPGTAAWRLAQEKPVPGEAGTRAHGAAARADRGEAGGVSEACGRGQVAGGDAEGQRCGSRTPGDAGFKR